MKHVVFILTAIALAAATQRVSAGTGDSPAWNPSYGITQSSYGMPAMAGTDALTGTAARPLSASTVGLMHKILGYTTAVLATASAITGFAAPQHLAHSITTYSTAGLATLTMITGYAAYADVITFRGGVTTQNSHVVLGTLSTVGLITSAIIGGMNVKHCAPGIISGVVLYASVIVVHF